jgi:hypothetical protein
MGFYDEMAQTVMELLQDDFEGPLLTITKVSRTPANAAKPHRGPAAGASGTTRVTGTGLVFPGTLERSERDGGQRRSGAWALIANSSLSSPTADLTKYNYLTDASSKRWAITEAVTFNPAGSTAVLTYLRLEA